ncbi:MAG: hypothetical protein ACHP65_09400 [Legionellales bacterium]
MPQSPVDTEKMVIAQKMVAWLFRDNDLSLSASEWARLLWTTIIKRNRPFSQCFFDALSQKISASFADSNLSDVKKDLLFYNALSYLAFANPQAGQALTIKGINYTIEKIKLTSGWLSAPYYAYGLHASTDPNAQSYLIFQGTTTPSDNGFLSGILADSRPNGAVGTQLYARGQKKIQQWIDQEHARTHKRVVCTGQSLGGAMSLHAYIHQPNKVDFFVVNPPSLTSREKRIYENQQHEPLSDKDVRILKVVSHTNDPVWTLGSCYLPKGTEVCRHGDKNENNIMAHARAPYCGAQSPEYQFVPHEYSQPVKNRYWKTLKPFLFIGACILHAIAWPMRLAIQSTHAVSEFLAKLKNNQSSAVAEKESSYSLMNALQPTGSKKDLEPDHTHPLLSKPSPQPIDEADETLDENPQHRPGT